MKEKTENLGKVAVTIEEGYWDIKKPYDKLTIVEREGTCTTFISRKPVPAGTSILNRNYWIKFSKWSDIPYEITQKFGDSDELAISQKTLTNKFSEVETEIQEGDEVLDQRLRAVEVHEHIMIDGGELEVATGYDLEHPESPRQEAAVPTVRAILDASDNEPHLNSTKRFINSDNLAKMYGYYLDNPEFIYLLLDSEYRIILGAKTNGDVVFGVGVPSQIIDYINEKIAELSLDEYEDIVAFLSDYLGSDTTLKAMIDSINERIPEVIVNPEFLEVITDSEDKVLEGIQQDGTKVIGGDLNVGGSANINGDFVVLGNMEVSGVLYKVIDNPEYLAAWVDAENKVIFGLKTDGKTYVGDAGFLDDIDWDALSSIITAKNPEFIEAKTDSEGKLLAGRTPDGVAFENVGFSTPKVSIAGHTIENFEDPEERTEVTTDAKGKIISYRDSDGVKHENVGFDSNEVSANSANFKHLELTSEGLTDFERALKANGFTPGGEGDFSDKNIVELPEPVHYGLLNLIIDSLPTYGNISEGYAVYYDLSGNFFKKVCEITPQGQTSRIFANTGGKGNYTLDIVDGSEIKFGSWVPQDSFHLKGCAKDVTRSYLATSYKFAYKIMEYLDAKPNRVLSKENNITTTNGTGDRFSDWPDDARCLPDGFPCEIYINGEYWGLYSWQLKKHRKNYSMDKSDYKTFFLDAEDFGDFWLGDIPWTSFEIKNPKDLYCMDGSKYDGDAPKELIDSTSQYYDSTNKKHKGSAQTKAIIQSWPTKYAEIKTLIDTNTTESLAEAKTKFAEYFDVNACMLVYILNCILGNADSISKNTLWGTYSDGKIAPMLWDLDGVYGEGWIGLDAGGPMAANVWIEYAVSSWPLGLFWTLYEAEIKTAYGNLRRSGIISIPTWKSIVFGWSNRVGKEAYERDIEKWPETPSYRKNYTNTDYWKQMFIVTSESIGDTPIWNASTQYSANDNVVLRLYEDLNIWMLYTAKVNNINQCPVTKFYNMFPQVGGFYDSPKRMEKWMIRQIELCDQFIGYIENN